MGIKLSGKRCEDIKRIIVKLFEQYDINCVPISSYEIATKMGVKVIPYSAYKGRTRELLLKKSKDGFCVELELGEWYIFYNDNSVYGRINNTIMHEIGHIVLGHTEDSELAEKEVNFFAKYALAPPVLIHKLQISNPQKISDIFDISYKAACYAYSYYNKWLRYGASDLVDYELKILRLFSEAG